MAILLHLCERRICARLFAFALLSASGEISPATFIVSGSAGNVSFVSLRKAKYFSPNVCRDRFQKDSLGNFPPDTSCEAIIINCRYINISSTGSHYSYGRYGNRPPERDNWLIRTLTTKQFTVESRGAILLFRWDWSIVI